MISREIMKFKAAIRAMALEEGIQAQVVLQHFMFERLLDRIVKTPIKDCLIIKGGYLVSHILGLAKRTTMDLDATLRNTPLTESNLRDMLEAAFALNVGDGVVFEIKSIEPIRDDDIYGGFRVKFTAKQDTILVSLSADFSTGDVITPEPKEYFLKSRFANNVSFRVWGYTIETILAEKVQTILTRGVLNTRPRDFYDVAILVESCKPNITLFGDALKATCAHRKTEEILQSPLERIEAIRSNKEMLMLWHKYQKQYAFAKDLSFNTVCDIIANLVKSVITE